MRCLEEVERSFAGGVRKERCGEPSLPELSTLCRAHCLERHAETLERRAMLLGQMKSRAGDIKELSLKLAALRSEQRRDDEAWHSTRWEIERYEQASREADVRAG